jgi:hypothetical protein
LQAASYNDELEKDVGECIVEEAGLALHGKGLSCHFNKFARYKTKLIVACLIKYYVSLSLCLSVLLRAWERAPYGA